MLNFYAGDYKPEPGQLCRTFKGKDNVYRLSNDINCLISDSLMPDELVMITKVNYFEELSSYYVEFMRDGVLYYTYFYEQVFHFMHDIDARVSEVIKLEEPCTTFDYPWVICE